MIWHLVFNTVHNYMYLRIHLPNRRLEFNPWVRKIPWRRKW